MAIVLPGQHGGRQDLVFASRFVVDDLVARCRDSQRLAYASDGTSSFPVLRPT